MKRFWPNFVDNASLVSGYPASWFYQRQGHPWTRYCRKLWVCHRSGLHAGWGDRGTKAAPDERIGAAPTGCFDIEQA